MFYSSGSWCGNWHTANAHKGIQYCPYNDLYCTICVSPPKGIKKVEKANICAILYQYSNHAKVLWVDCVLLQGDNDEMGISMNEVLFSLRPI